jgi:acyl dehydratase
MTGIAAFDQLQALVGMETGPSVVHVERGPVAVFADAVLDDSPEYRDPGAAAAAGFDAIAVPPTFPIAMTFWGAFGDVQPEGPSSGGVGDARFGVDALLGAGGLRLHGEQEFEYHRPIVVGDELEGTARVVDVYTKQTPARTMIFIVYSATWRDRRTGEPVLTTTRSLVWIPS